VTVVIVFALCVLNIILWIVFFHRFSKIFSTDDIIENTRTELNRMIGDVNRNTERNITLIEDRIKELKKIIAEADKRMALYASEQKKHTLGTEYRTTIDKVSLDVSENEKKLRETPIQKAAGKYRKNAENPVGAAVSQETVYSITPRGFKQTTESEQAELFQPLVEEKSMTSATASETITSDAVPKVFMSENPIVSKKDFNVKVQELYEKGETIEKIASALSSSITEVQFAIDMNDQL
jgi:hypothetical protein